ncbi:response regulator [Paeniroseomonas aquatica]|uniref:histidine kinase n=1 Tax=Paeniroseomonas aquatica TaxID=373043 RepID=A0ABT8A6B1_9PROT|nr:ATP-binding protein [Paeniroseomonas aquatica]MDN3565327.1 response regulator [Paeniroseomonas aquatica]
MQEPAPASAHGVPRPGPGPDAAPAHPAGFDAEACAREPIHLPGAIQPHGALLAALAADGRITHASGNAAGHLGTPAEALLGRPLRAVIGEAAWAALAGTPTDGRALRCLAQPPAGPMLQLRAHRTGRHLCLDLEPPSPAAAAESPLLLVQPTLERFRAAADLRELCELAVQGLRQLTGYDRVMAYRFDAEGHGEVFAEARDPALEPLLGLRYPAADVPAQARRQYLRQSLGLVADSAYRPVPILTAEEAPLDLTHSSLRSVSPVHREYMRNMGTAASLTLALAPGPDRGRDHGEEPPEEALLWGLLVCHHRQPRLPDLETRLAADLLGKVVSVLLASLRTQEIEAERRRRRPALRAVLRGLPAALPLPEALAAAGPDFLAVTGATGAVVRLGGLLLPLGRTPPLAVADRALALLQARATGSLVETDSLGRLDGEFAGCAAEASGALLVRLGHGAGDAVVWFRPELARTVTWGGNPAEHAGLDPASGRISPRRSFAAWQELVRGRSLPWSAADRSLARRIGHALAAEQAERVRQELASVLQQASRAKSRFLAGMSHELRTPLNGVLGHAQLLSLDGGLGPAQARRVEAMLTAGKHMLRIIGGVLELSEIEADHAVPEPTAFDPRGVAQECLDVVRPMAEAKGLSLQPVIAAEVPPAIVADPTRFRQILLNLLGNAVKFTGAGGVELRLRLTADGRSLRVEVADTGPGIDPGKRHRLFQAFQRLGGTEDPSGSAGLGLAITARLATLLGGCLGHEDNPGGGSLFWLELPPGDVAAAAAEGRVAPEAAPAALPVQGGPSLRILVADDSAINRDVAQGFLQAAGHAVALAEDGDEAAAAAAGGDFDLILMDLRMPRLDGIGATRWIRALPGPRGRVPIVALTAQAFAEQLEECRGAGMDGHLVKPFTMEGLLAAIAKGMAARRQGPPAPP